MIGKRPMVAPFDLLVNMVIVFAIIALISVPRQKQAQIETLGYYAITMTWPKGYQSDIDLWIRAPDGGIIYYANSDSDGVSLEHDDLGSPDTQNYERAILRQVEPGEYVMNAMYYKQYPGEPPVHVHVELWRLQGQDRKITEADVVLSSQGQERTAFRFRAPNHITHLETRLQP